MKSSKLIAGLFFLLAVTMLNAPSNIGQTNIENADDSNKLEISSPNNELKENSNNNNILEQEFVENSVDSKELDLFTNDDQVIPSLEEESEITENNQDQPTWLELARMSMTGLSATGTLQVNTQIGSLILQNVPIEIRNSTNHVVASGFSDILGNKTFDLNNETYTVIVQQDNNITIPVFVAESSTTTVTANFGYLNITTQDETPTLVDAQIEVRSNSITEITNLQTGVDGNIILIVAPKIYDIIAIYSYGDTKSGITVNSGLYTDVIFSFGDIAGKFGGLEVTASGYFNMPMTSVVNIYYYPSGASAASGTTNGATGKAFWNLAPDVYTVVVSERSSMSFGIVTIQDSIQTNLSIIWGTVIVYKDNTSETFVELYDETNTNRLNYGWIDGTGKFVINAHPGQYVIRYSGFNHLINITAGSRQLINSQRNIPLNVLNPAQPYNYVTAGRVYANESTNISIVLVDPDYDYANFSFSWTPNIGTVTGIDTWNRFQFEHQFVSTVTYNAPTTNQTMYVDIFVDDNNGGNYSYRIYLSNRVGTISVNSTQLNGLAKTNTFIDLYRSNGLRITYGWASASGWVNFTNVLEDEYIIYATESNVQDTGVFFLNGSESKLVNFKWSLLSVNSTGLNGQLIDTSVQARSSDGSIIFASGTTSLSGNGYYTFYLSQGNYSLAGYEFNDFLKFGLEVTAEQQIFHEFKFGIVAAYYLDDQGNPQSKFVQVFNQTTGIRENYGWTNAQGLLVMILVPFNNYSIHVDHNATLTYIYGNLTNPIVLLPNQGLNIGQFVNNAPVFTSYSASPARIDPNQTSIITISAYDPDPLDILTYTFTPSVGLITGTGSVVNYTAPATTGFYYLNISISDPHGSEINFTRSLSNRVGDISITLLGYKNVTLYNNFVELWDITTGIRYTYGWTNTGGQISFINVPESFYFVRANAHNSWDTEIFIPGPDTGLYSKTFRFSSFFVNATGGQNQLIVMPSQVHFNSVNQNSQNTIATGTGQVQFLLRPDVYDVRGLMVNDQWFNDISLIGKEADSVNLTFNWAEFNISVRAGSYMPMGSFVEIYNSSLTSRYTYAWPSIATGSITWFGRPGNFYQLRATEGSSTIFINLNVTAGNLYNLNAHFGTVRLLGSDINNQPTNVVYNIYFNNTGVYVGGGSTGTDGALFIHLAPGYYDITNGTYTFEDILVNPLQVLQIGSNTVNNYPVIIVVTPSPARIGPNSSTTIVLEASDIDYDYPTFSVDVSVNTGSFDLGVSSWSQKDRWRYTFVYHSPMSSGFYELNMTLNDGRGLSRTFTLHVSDQQASLNIETLGNALRPLQSSSVNVYNAYTGASIAGGSTDVNGMYSILLYDDLYNIRVGRHNNMWSYYVWVRNGEIVNITYLWGEITIHATGVNDVPLQNAFIEVINQTTLIRYTYGWTPADGKLSFILAPGMYRIVITPSGGTAITFNNILIEGGSGLSLGSAVPDITKPSDVSYEEGSSGNEIIWTLTDTNPDKYYITLDGITVVNSTNWTTGQSVVFNIDGLAVGDHTLIIFANDTTDLIQTDIIFISVYADTFNPSVNTPNQITFTALTSGNFIVYSVSDTNPDYYILYFNGSIDRSGLWASGSLAFNLDGLTPGLYEYSLYLNDTKGYSITSGNTNVVVLTPVFNAPLVTLISPTENSAHNSATTITFDVTDDDQVTQVFYIWDTESSNSTKSSPFTGITTSLPLVEGTRSLTVYAENNHAKWTVRVFTFNVDFTNPIITLVSPVEESIQNPGISVDLNIVDTNGISQVLFNWDDGSNATLGFPYDTNLPSSEGLHQLEVFAKDSAGNWVYDSFSFAVEDNTPPQAIISISSPSDQSWSSDEISGKTVEWQVTYFNSLGNTWSLSVNGIVFQTGSVSNGSSYSFNIDAFGLGAGLHRLIFSVQVQDLASNFVSGIDYVHITIKAVQTISAGTTDIDLGGITNTTISLTVDSEVELTVETLPAPTSQSSTAFQALEQSNGAINTGYFLDITISDESAIQNVWINVSYAGWDLVSLGITDESSLRIYYFDEDVGDWVPAGNTGVDTIRKIIYANVDHFSAYAAVAFAGSSSTETSGTSNTSIGTETQTTQGGIPGFEFFFVLISILSIGLVNIRKRNKFSK